LKQNHGIRAAGNGDEDFLPARKQMAILNFAVGALEEFVHAEKLLDLCGRANAGIAQRVSIESAWQFTALG
jgi:hypothetical protein